ncbi:hypothetical protein [Baekduia sp.]|uniref:hypothetical protein n=1 Tax=Baekduia sp. TaxID=2600305 RepID=UPI002E03F0C5|nr:hypothetical protein [Baekduia sp.]
MTRLRKVRMILAALAAATSALLALGVAPAFAALQFPSAGQIAGPSAGTPFSLLKSESVAVNDTNGHILVADSGTGLVYDFTSAVDTTPTTWDGTSTPAGSFGGASVAVAVDNASGDVYVADQAHAVIDKFDSAGVQISSFGDSSPAADGQLAGTVTPAGSFSPASSGTFGIAVDQATHDLYVLDAGHQVIDVFDSTGAYQSQISDAAAVTAGLYGCGGAYADGIAVSSSTGHVFVSDSCAVQAFEFDSSGSFVKAWGGSNTPAGSFGGYVSLGIDDTSGDIYISDTGDAVTNAFNASGSYLGQITATPGGSFGAVAADPATGDVYVSDNATAAVGVFGAAVIVPDATTNAATAVGPASATLNGTLNPGGVPLTSCRFSYGPDTSYGATVPCDQLPASLGSGTSDVTVSADISGLDRGSVTHFRLEAANAFGTSVGQDQTLATVSAGFGFSRFSFKVLDQDGNPYTQAGGHPYEVENDVAFNLRADSSGGVTPDQLVKDLSVSLPPGLVGDPTAVPQCPISTLQSFANSSQPGQGTSCPPSSQIGTATLLVDYYAPNITAERIPIYNLVPQDGLPAQFGFTYFGFVAVIDNALRTGSDYGLDSTSGNITTFLPIKRIHLDLWGVPADPSHTGDRSCHGVQIGDGRGGEGGCASSVQPRPFFTNPTSCSGPQTVTGRADSWQDAGNFVTTTTTLPATTGCDKLQFKPSLTLQPDTSAADSPTGPNVDLKVPQPGLQDPNGLSSSNLKKAVVTLPAGLTVNPAAADGLAACTPAEIGINNASKPTCPDASKVGTAEVHTPLLPNNLKGSLYLATPHDNPFGTLLAGYLVVNGDGVLLKLAGRFDTDPNTGQITATFDQNPQQPFDDLKLSFFSGPRAPLATPGVCGTYTTHSVLTPWSTPFTSDALLQDSFEITSGCVDGFRPTFKAGTTTPQAGAFSPFVLSFSRSDTDEEMSGLKVTLPSGLLAKVAGVPLCSDADAAAGACPEASQVGSVSAGSGVGPSPLFLPGKAYLTGPYKGGPYGLAVVVPAKAGPFDLGNVVVRQKLEIDPIDAHVTATSDPFPTILQGIPLRVRRVDVTLDRPSFTLNPTSCAAKQIQAQLVSTSGTLADLAAPFSAGGCGDLAYAPKLAIALTGKGQTTDDKHPGVHAVLTQPVGQANNKKVTVSLPLSLALDPDNAQSLCEFADGSKVDPTCPKGSVVGHATARTPILDQPLTGPVYFVKNIRKDPKSGREIRTLPKLVIPLTGQNGLRLTVTGMSNVVDNQLVTTFDNLPDAPVSDFTLDIDGGKHGILVVSGTDICKASQIATREADGQNGKQANADVYLQTTACPLKIISKKVGKTSVAIKIGGLGAGKVTVTGKGIKKTSKTIANSTVATITAKRTKGKPGKVTVSFDPAGPAKAHKTSK